jgi:uncharacterized protein
MRFEVTKKPLVVLDTNVFLSGLISPKGPPASILLIFRSGEFNIATSKAQVKEISLVLKRPSLSRALPPGTPKEILKFFLAFKNLTKIYEPKKLFWEFPDKNDHFLLDLALHSRSDFLISGDKKLLSLSRIGSCEIISPGEFLNKI